MCALLAAALVLRWWECACVRAARARVNFGFSLKLPAPCSLLYQVAMFTVLRRFNIPITLFLNWLLLNR